MKVLPLVSGHLSVINERWLPSSSPPLEAKQRMPISPQTKWDSSSGVLKKTFQFDADRSRYEFIIGLMGREVDVGHRAKITIDNDKVGIELITHDVNQITELDREYAKFCDALFKDLTTIAK